MSSINLSEDTKLQASLKFLWAVGVALVVVSFWVTTFGFRLDVVEAKTTAIETKQEQVDADRIKRREEIVAAIYDLKAEVVGLRTEIRSLKKINNP